MVENYSPAGARLIRGLMALPILAGLIFIAAGIYFFVIEVSGPAPLSAYLIILSITLAAALVLITIGVVGRRRAAAEIREIAASDFQLGVDRSALVFAEQGNRRRFEWLRYEKVVLDRNHLAFAGVPMRPALFMMLLKPGAEDPPSWGERRRLSKLIRSMAFRPLEDDSATIVPLKFIETKAATRLFEDAVAAHKAAKDGENGN